MGGETAPVSSSGSAPAWTASVSKLRSAWSSGPSIPASWHHGERVVDEPVGAVQEGRDLPAGDVGRRAERRRATTLGDARRGEGVDVGLVRRAVVVGEGVRRRGGQLVGTSEQRRELGAGDRV